MKPILDAKTMAALDRHTIETIGVPGAVLMETAGRAVVAAIDAACGDRLTGRSAPVWVLCGPGNNGGDGFVIARVLTNRKVPVRVFLLGRAEKVAGDARTHLVAYRKSGGKVEELTDEAGAKALTGGGPALVVDALFGTGLARPVEGLAALLVGAVNRMDCPVISVDIPSGVDADTGAILGVGVRATATVTFAFLKKGHLNYPGAGLCGPVTVAEIGITAAGLADHPADLFALEATDFRGTFVRAPDAHKGHFGHLGILAGGWGKMGASALAGLAAMRAGAGLVTAAFPAPLLPQAKFAPELMTEMLGGPEGDGRWSVALLDEILAFADRVDALLIGPGMGTGAAEAALLDALLPHLEGKPAVLDADALTLLARRPDWSRAVGEEMVLTPHPGEAARLLGTDNADIQSDREAAVRALTRGHGGVAVLKGAGTLIATGDAPMTIHPHANPALATAGSGDVLGGTIGAFLARGLPAVEAARAGVWVHGAAGRLAAGERGDEGVIASDLIGAIPPAMAALADPHPSPARGLRCEAPMERNRP